jgi:hypothetical protein
MNLSFSQLTTRLPLVCTAFAFALFLALSGCQQVVSNVELPYEEKINIEGLLQSGFIVDNVVVSRTLDPLKRATADEAFMRDADVSVSVDGRSTKATARLDSVSLSLLQPMGVSVSISSLRGAIPVYSVPSMTVEAGKTYTITVRWNGKTATASTRVPDTPRFVGAVTTNIQPDTILVQPSPTRPGTFPNPGSTTTRLPALRLTMTANVEASADTDTQLRFYSADTVWNTAQAKTDTITVFAGVSRLLSIPSGISPAPTPFTAQTVVGYGNNTGYPIEAALRIRILQSRFYAVVVSYDAAYNRWRSTSGRGLSGGGPFGAGGLNPLWNVTGDGIGIFASVTTLEVPVKVQ